MIPQSNKHGGQLRKELLCRSRLRGLCSLQVVEEWSLKEFEDGFMAFETSDIKQAVDDIMSLAPR